MLRAGTSIRFNKDVLDSENGILLSPIINLCGLILRADRPAPDVIKIFLESKGAELRRVRYKGELYIRLRGHYRLTKADLENFISEHQELVNQQSIGLDEIHSSINLQSEIGQKIEKITEPFVFQEFGKEYSFQSDVIIQRGMVNLEAGEGYNNNACRISSRSELFINAPEIINNGRKILGLINKVGFFAESMANGNITMRSQIGIHKNAIIDASQVLTIEPDDSQNPSKEELRLDPMIKWVNNPHPDLLQPKEVTDTADLLASADEMLTRIRLGVRI